MFFTCSVEIGHMAHVGTARRAAHDFAKHLGFSVEALAEVDIVVQEIGTNAALYASGSVGSVASGGGILHIGSPAPGSEVLELLYLDRGPGIFDIDRAIRDGVSTNGSLGAGLGAVRRLVDEFEIYSTTPELARSSLLASRRSTHGTALLARKYSRRGIGSGVKEYTGRFGVMTRPKPGEEVNGDAFLIIDRGVSTLITVIDGLGHGSGAHQAAEAAKDVIGQWDGEPPGDLIRLAHDALRSTRGAVIGIAVINEGNNTLQYAGVGNIEARVVRGEQTHSPISTYGTVGARLGTIKGWSCEWGGSTLIMASDGLSSSWSLESYPGLLLHSPQLIAAVLMRDNVRASDDATVVVAR